MEIYATPGTAAEIGLMGIESNVVPLVSESREILDLMENGKVKYIIYTGALRDDTLKDYQAIHCRAMQLGIPCFTSLDTADALAQIIASRFSEFNTEIVDINHMRRRRGLLRFAKMESSGNDYIFIENFDDTLPCPESLCVTLCTQHYGIGASGIVLIESSDVADAKMRSFNRDGSEGRLAGNNLRCVAKYLFDKGIVRREQMRIETASGIKQVEVFLRDGKVSSVSVDMGPAILQPELIPVNLPGDRIVDQPITVDGEEYRVTCVSVGSPHCVVFTEKLGMIPLSKVGPKFEYHPLFPERINTEFVRVVNRTTLRLRVWERGNGATLACGTGACAAAVAAVENGLCDKNTDILVKMPGGDLIVNVTDSGVILTGDAKMVFEGKLEY